MEKIKCEIDGYTIIVGNYSHIYRHDHKTVHNFWYFSILDGIETLVIAKEYKDQDAALRSAKNNIPYLLKNRPISPKRKPLTQRLAAYLMGFFTRAKS